MSYETLRFGWQKLLINQVPQKGGGGGNVPAQQDQWAQAQKSLGNAVKVIDEVRSTWGRVAAEPTAAPGIVTANNAKLQAEIANTDGIINTLASLPEYSFEGSTINKPQAINLFQQSRNNLAAMIQAVPNPPPPPAPPPPPPPPKPVIIAPAVEPQPARPVPVPAPIIIDNKPPREPPPPVVVLEPAVVINPAAPPIINGSGKWIPNGRVLGYGTYVPGQQVIIPPGRNRGVFAEDGKSYAAAALVPTGLRYSYESWYWQPDNVPPPPPQPVYVPPAKTPTAYELLSKELEKQTKQLQAANRIMNKPIDPAPPEFIYPSTSWQYELWNKGYSLNEVSWAETEAGKRNLLSTTGGDFAMFKAKVEDLLQDAIISGQLGGPAIGTEVVTISQVGTDSNGNIVVPETSVANTLPVNERAVMPPSSVNMNPVFIDAGGKVVPPKNVPSVLRRRRVFVPSVRPIEDLPSIPQGSVTTNTVPSRNNWEDAAVGAGASVAELDTIRRMMSTTKFEPGTDLSEVAKNMLISVRNPMPTGLARLPAGLGVPTLNDQNPVNNIPGVIRCGTSTVNMIRSNSIAQKKTQQARRGALNNRITRTRASLNEGGNQ